MVLAQRWHTWSAIPSICCTLEPKGQSHSDAMVFLWQNHNFTEKSIMNANCRKCIWSLWAICQGGNRGKPTLAPLSPSDFPALNILKKFSNWTLMWTSHPHPRCSKEFQESPLNFWQPVRNSSHSWVILLKAIRIVWRQHPWLLTQFRLNVLWNFDNWDWTNHFLRWCPQGQICSNSLQQNLW